MKKSGPLNPDRQRCLVLLALALLIALLPLRQWLETRSRSARMEEITPEHFLWLAGEGVTAGLYVVPAPTSAAQLYRHFRLAEPAPVPPSQSSPLPPLATVTLTAEQPATVGALHPRATNIFFRPLPINEADAELLTVIPGIGPKLAAKIVAKRQELGGFSNLEELRQVPGIGPKTLSVVGRYISVGGDLPSR